jgi:hypothetical protein
MQNIREAIQRIPTRLNNISTSTLQTFGNDRIVQIVAIRTPLSAKLNKMMNLISFGRFEEIKQKFNRPVLYHTSLLLTLDSGNKIIFEKLEVVHIAPYVGEYDTSEDEKMNVPVTQNLTLNEFVTNTMNYMGKERFYDYDGMGADEINNCQKFCMSALKANNLLTEPIKQFLDQNLEEMMNYIKKSSISYMPKIVKTITDTSSKFSRLIGKGAYSNDRNLKLYEYYLAQNQFKFI